MIVWIGVSGIGWNLLLKNSGIDSKEMSVYWQMYIGPLIQMGWGQSFKFCFFSTSRIEWINIVLIINELQTMCWMTVTQYKLQFCSFHCLRACALGHFHCFSSAHFEVWENSSVIFNFKFIKIKQLKKSIHISILLQSVVSIICCKRYIFQVK